MAEGAVRLSITGRIAHILFDRPAAHNALTWDMYDGLAAAVETIHAKPDLRLAILRGAGGRAFVAGTDISQFQAFTNGRDGIAYEERIESYVAALEMLPIPTLAVVEGMAIGGGLAIANACDLRIATTGAKFGVPIARTVGNCLSSRNLARLSRTMGLPFVQRMLLASELITAEQLAPLGYFSALVDPSELEKSVSSLSERLINLAPITLSATRQMLARQGHGEMDEADDLIDQCYGSWDFREGVSAFIAKRPPEWRGV